MRWIQIKNVTKSITTTLQHCYIREEAISFEYFVVHNRIAPGKYTDAGDSFFANYVSLKLLY